MNSKIKNTKKDYKQMSKLWKILFGVFYLIYVLGMTTFIFSIISYERTGDTFRFFISFIRTFIMGVPITIIAAETVIRSGKYNL